MALNKEYKEEIRKQLESGKEYVEVDIAKIGCSINEFVDGLPVNGHADPEGEKGVNGMRGFEKTMNGICPQCGSDLVKMPEHDIIPHDLNVYRCTKCDYCWATILKFDNIKPASDFQLIKYVVEFSEDQKTLNDVDKERLAFCFEELTKLSADTDDLEEKKKYWALCERISVLRHKDE